MEEIQNKMEKVLSLYKDEGETPLECLERFRDENPQYKDLPMTYAGRLDPMAEGLLLVLVGEECKNKEKYLEMDKEYEIEVLFGFETDTYDILGKLISTNLSRADIKNVEEVIKKSIGKFTQEYPMYSSKTVKGISLFSYARGTTDEKLLETLPTKQVEIFDIKIEGENEILAGKLLENIEKRIEKVKGDFRQEEILNLWRKAMKENVNPLSNDPTSFQIIKLKVSCSSGTYMRTLAHELGKTLSTGAIAFSIKRLKIGTFSL